jgi:DNA-damage-inducible protein J
MSETTNISVRIDKEIKQKAEAIFNELGLNMSTAVNMFLRYSIRYGGIPFELQLDVPNEETRAAIDDVNNKRNLSKTFDSVKDLMDDLNA